MSRVVVDASVVAAAFFQEEHAEPAGQLLASDRELHVPDLLYAEMGNVIWKRCRRGEINADEAAHLAADLLRLSFRVTPSSELLDPALRLAIETGCTVYDCLYLALAITCEATVVSNDLRLVNALAPGPAGKYIVPIGDAP